MSELVVIDNRPPAMDYAEIWRVRSAALRATRVYPGPVGELVAIELRDWADFGYRFGDGGVIGRLVEHVMAMPLVETEAA